MNKKNIPLFIALAIPVLMILLVAAFVYLPGVGQKPKYNFVYMTGQNIYYYYGPGTTGYYVSGGKLVYNPPTTNLPPGTPKPDNAVPHFYIYDVSKDTATEITFAQAQNYMLDSSSTSADGYAVERGNGGGGDFLFGSTPSDYNSWYIKGHNRSRKLNLKLTGTTPYYADNFQFLGWIE